MSTYRSHNGGEESAWHEIVGESGEQGEGCLTAITDTLRDIGRALGWAIVGGIIVAVALLGSALAAFQWDMW